jgi:hypothetical protein
MSEKARLQTNICDTRTLRTGRYQEATSRFQQATARLLSTG